MCSGKAVKNTVVIVLFICILAIPLLTISWTGDVVSEQEKRQLAPFPVLFQQEEGWNPDFFPEAVAWLEDHIGFRSKMVELVSLCKLKLMHQSPSDSVHVGSRGWYYYTRQGNIGLATGDYELTEEMLAQFLNQLLTARDRLHERGTEFVVVLPPSKSSVYSENLRVPSQVLEVTPVDIVEEYITAHSDLKIIRLKPVLLDAKKDVQVYSKTDTHWTDDGAYIATEKILQKLQEYGFCDAVSFSSERSVASSIGDLMSMMGLEIMEQGHSITLRGLHSQLADSTLSEFSGIYAAVGSSGCKVYTNSFVDTGKLLLFCDSFFNAFPITQQMLAEAFSEFALIHDYSMHADFIDAFDPDLVIWEATERRLIELSRTSFVQLRHYQTVDGIDQTAGVNTEKLQNGALKVVVTDDYDPKIVFSPLPSAAIVPELCVQLGYIGEAGRFQLFFAGEDGKYTTAQYFYVTPEQNQYQISLDGVPEIKYIRLDFPNIAGAEYCIDSLKIATD